MERVGEGGRGGGESGRSWHKQAPGRYYAIMVLLSGKTEQRVPLREAGGPHCNTKSKIFWREGQ